MNIKKRIFTFLLSCVCVIGTGTTVSAKVINIQPSKVAIGYNFPIKPGTASWNELEDTSARVQACLIPEGMLKELTTDQLIETILKYPFMRDIYAYNTTQEGFLSVSKNFNGLSELLQRNDAATKILAKYKNMQVLTDATKITSANDNQIFNMTCIEILLAQDQISSKATNAEKVEIQNTQKQSLDMSLYATTGTVYTPHGSAVSVFTQSPDYTAAQKLANDNYVKTTYPGTTLLRSSTNQYNCHSYAWYDVSSWNRYWMNSPSAYISDGSYTRQSIPSIGCKIYYNYGTHSGIVSSTNSSYPEKVTSKWGGLGLVSHKYNNSPYLPINLNYYK